MTSIRDLAAHLRISIGTVSRALNGKEDVSAETRRRVVETARALGYVPNQSGRSLRKGATNTVGLILAQGANRTGGSDTFFPELIDGLQFALAKHHLDLVVLLSASTEHPFAYLQRMVARGIVDALVITATQRIDPRIDFLEGAGVPFVALGRSQSGRDHAWVDLDFEGAARQAVDRLVAGGHRRIAIVAPDSTINLGDLFMKGYRDALAAHGIAFDPEIALRAETSEQGGYEVANAILALRNRPTAVVLTAELMSVGLYRRLGEAGLAPGRDLAIIAERESPVGRYLLPRLTCFQVGERDLGIRVGEILLSLISAYHDVYPDVPRQLMWPMRLSPGESDPPISRPPD